jgi:hypothetical protein
MASLADIGNFISSLDAQATAWYRGISTGTAVVVPSTSAGQAATQQLAIQQAAQANLVQTNPLVAGLTSSPLLVFAILAILVFALFMLLRR